MLSTKVERLTPEQLAQLEPTRDEWLGVGLATGPVDRTAAVDALKRAYQTAGLEPPSLFVWMPSPMAGAIACAILKEPSKVRDQVIDQVSAQVSDQVRDQVRAQVSAQVIDQVSAQVSDQVRDQVSDQVRDQVRAQVRAQVSAQVRDQVRDQVIDQVSAQVSDQVRDQVRAQVSAQVIDQVSAQVSAQVIDQVSAQVSDQVREGARSFVWWYGPGQADAHWLSFYSFFQRALGLECCERLRPLADLARNCGWWWGFKTIAVLTERPVEIHRNARNQLHRDGGPALVYPDGFGVWALNGVRMDRALVEAPAASLKADLVLHERNAEKRRELVRKIGIGRVCSDLGAKVIDRWQGYELLTLELGDGRERPYLRMKNPSIDATHVEGVHPDCKTVRQALAWRNGGIQSRPAVLT